MTGDQKWAFDQIFWSGPRAEDLEALARGETNNPQLRQFVFQLDRAGDLVIFPRLGETIEILVPQATSPSPTAHRVVWFVRRTVGNEAETISFPDWVCGPKGRGCLAIASVKARLAEK